MRLIGAALALACVLGIPTRSGVAQQPDGKTLFQDNCRKCHGLAGKPTHMALTQYPKIPTMDAAFAAARSVDSIVTILTRGKGEDMKAFKQKLTPAEMRAVAEYVRAMASGPKP